MLKINRAYVTGFDIIQIDDGYYLEWFKDKRIKRRFIATEESVQDWIKTNTITARVYDIKTSLDRYFSLCRVDRDSLGYALTMFHDYCASNNNR